MWQRAINTVLSLGVTANGALLGYLYLQCQRTVDELEGAADGPFELPGNGLSHYDLSSPEAMLKSVRQMVVNVDLKADWSTQSSRWRRRVTRSLSTLFSKDAELSVEKARVIKNSHRPNAAGTILAFVRVTADGVEHHFVGRTSAKEACSLAAVSSFTTSRRTNGRRRTSISLRPSRRGKTPESCSSAG